MMPTTPNQWDTPNICCTTAPVAEDMTARMMTMNTVYTRSNTGYSGPAMDWIKDL